MTEPGSALATQSSDTPPDIHCEVSIVIPCLNERTTIGQVVQTAVETLRTQGFAGEVILADNGSTDGSQEIARAAGGRVVDVAARGYGSALTGGMLAAHGDYFIIGDADDTYDFREIGPFVNLARQGCDLVMGSRFTGNIEPGAMPPLHRYLGTPLLTALINVFFRVGISDCNAGMRLVTREAFRRMNVHSTGMEFASEMIIKAGLLRMNIAEVPITLRRDRRGRPPHLRTWPDGWRHLRFILTYAADQLFMYPGLGMVLLGILGFATLLWGPVKIQGFTLDYHYLFPCSLLLMIGTEVILFAAFADSYTGLSQYREGSPLMRLLTFENGIVAGSILFILGLAINIGILLYWIQHYPKDLFAVRACILSTTLMAVGTQIFFSSFVLGVLSIPTRRG